MKVNSNIQAMIAGNVLKNNELRQSDSTRKMSSGYKINKAKDNPAGMAISNRMRAQIQSLNRANQNASNAVNVIETAEGALSEIQDMVQRMSELSVKAANGTNTSEDRAAIQSEINQLTSEIQRIAKDTEYNGQNLLGGEQKLKGYADDLRISVTDYDPDFPLKDYQLNFSVVSDGEGGKAISVDPATVLSPLPNGIKDATAEGNRIEVLMNDGSRMLLKVNLDEYNIGDSAAEVTAENPDGTVGLNINGVGGMKIQVGSSEGQEINIVIPEISLDNLGLEGIDVRTEDGAKTALDQTKYALSFISSVRSRLGAYENRFENTISNLDVAEENLTQSFSTIRDVDMADEMVEYTTLQVLVQAGTSMLSQANEQPQQALQLLQ